MTRLELGREQAIGRDNREVEPISYSHQSGLLASIEGSNRGVVARIELDDARVFVNEFRLVIAHPIDLVRDLLEIGLPHRDANRFLSAEMHADAGITGPGYGDRLGAAPLVGERIDTVAAIYDRRTRQIRNRSVRSAVIDRRYGVHERTCDRDFVDTVFG